MWWTPMCSQRRCVCVYEYMFSGNIDSCGIVESAHYVVLMFSCYSDITIHFLFMLHFVCTLRTLCSHYPAWHMTMCM